MFNWLISYLSDHYQSIKIGSTLSASCKLLFRVPQGSVLGPLLFSMYTTPLSAVISRHTGVSFHFYADDTQLYMHLSDETAPSAIDNINRCLHAVKAWMSISKLKLKLKLNPEKT